MNIPVAKVKRFSPNSLGLITSYTSHPRYQLHPQKTPDNTWKLPFGDGVRSKAWRGRGSRAHATCPRLRPDVTAASTQVSPHLQGPPESRSQQEPIAGRLQTSIPQRLSWRTEKAASLQNWGSRPPDPQVVSTTLQSCVSLGSRVLNPRSCTWIGPPEESPGSSAHQEPLPCPLPAPGNRGSRDVRPTPRTLLHGGKHP